MNEVPAILQRIWTAPKPVVAGSRGLPRAGGVGLVAACDIAVAATAATFAFSEVRIGVVPAVISVTVLPRLLPRAAHELFLTGETFDATRALAVGLVNAAVPAEELDDEVARYVGMLRLGAPGALAATKEMLRADRPAGARRPVRRDAHALRPVLRGRGGPGGHARVRRETPAPLGHVGRRRAPAPQQVTLLPPSPQRGHTAAGLRGCADSTLPDRIFEVGLEAAAAAGLVGRRRVLDSTPLYDAVATMDTVTLIRSAVRGAARRSPIPTLSAALRRCLAAFTTTPVTVSRRSFGTTGPLLSSSSTP